MKVKKRILEVRSPEAEKYVTSDDPELTEAKFLSGKVPGFNTVMNIYNNKVTYITLVEDSMIGVIIEDPHIYKMHRILFDNLWNNTH